MNLILLPLKFLYFNFYFITMKKAFYLLLLVAILGFSSISCTGSEGNEVTTSPEKIEDNQKKDKDSTKAFEIGDKIKLGDYVVKVTKIEDPYKEENEFSQPESGNRFVAVEVYYENPTEDKTLSYNPFDWTLYDSEGYTYEQAFTASKDPSLSSGTLNSKGKVKGWVTFEVGKKAKGFKIQFTPDWLSNDNVEIEL